MALREFQLVAMVITESIIIANKGICFAVTVRTDSMRVEKSQPAMTLVPARCNNPAGQTKHIHMYQSVLTLSHKRSTH